MDTKPSGQDERQAESFGTDYNLPFLIRVICNQLGKMQVDVYQYSQGLVFRDVDWAPYFEQTKSAEEALRNEVKQKVKSMQASLFNVDPRGRTAAKFGDKEMGFAIKAEQTQTNNTQRKKK
jgi:hypothetical protein